MVASAATRRAEIADRFLAVVAALPEEVAPLWRRLEGAQGERCRAGKARSGHLSGRRVIVMATGDGAIRARRGVAELIGRHPLVGLIAIGIAGGLSADLAVGDVIAGRQVIDESGEVVPPDAALLAAAIDLPGVRSGVVFSHSQVAVDPVAKQRLWHAGGEHEPMVVDLESAAFARESAARSVPYSVLRAVSDSRDEALPLDFNRFRRSDGSSDRLRILRHSLLHPSIVPELLQLRDRLRYCADRLGECVEAWVGR